MRTVTGTFPFSEYTTAREFKPGRAHVTGRALSTAALLAAWSPVVERSNINVQLDMEQLRKRKALDLSSKRLRAEEAVVIAACLQANR